MIPLADFLDILDPIANPLSDVLEWLHTAIGLSWGWAIVVLTVLIRLVLVPLTLKQLRSMQRLQYYAPQLKELQAKYKGNKQKLNEEVMKFYKEKKVNPAASCLPILVQIPIFIALFAVLRDFDEEVIVPKFPDSDLSFIRIVPDITETIGQHWSGILLLVVYVTSQVASTFFMMTTADKRQRMLFLALPFFFIPFIIRFPVGLLLYWITTNVWTAGQGIITRRLFPRPPPPPDKRSSRTPPEERRKPAPAEAAQPARKRKRRKRQPPARVAAHSDGAPSDAHGDGAGGAAASEADVETPAAAQQGGKSAKQGATKKPGSPGVKPGSAKQGAGKKTQPGQVRRRKKRGPKKGPRTPR